MNLNVAQTLPASIEELNRAYGPLTAKERLERIYEDFDNVLLTSSFGTTAACLLQLVAEVRPGTRVYFIDTGYHFEETMQYQEWLVEQLGLTVETLYPNLQHHQLTRQQQMWRIDNQRCCDINKVQPLEGILPRFDLWLSGVMGWQSRFRKTFDLFQQRGDTLKAYPLIDLSEEWSEGYIRQHKLPIHPLQPQGYESVGCTHCTQRGEGRAGRWADRDKTECGLHL